MLAPRKKLWSTPAEVVEAALELLEPSTEDIIYDLGNCELMLQQIPSNVFSYLYSYVIYFRCWRWQICNDVQENFKLQVRFLNLNKILLFHIRLFLISYYRFFADALE